jgi:hypothetical protein
MNRHMTVAALLTLCIAPTVAGSLYGCGETGGEGTTDADTDPARDGLPQDSADVGPGEVGADHDNDGDDAADGGADGPATGDGPGESGDFADTGTGDTDDFATEATGGEAGGGNETSTDTGTETTGGVTTTTGGETQGGERQCAAQCDGKGCDTPWACPPEGACKPIPCTPWGACEVYVCLPQGRCAQPGGDNVTGTTISICGDGPSCNSLPCQSDADCVLRCAG